MFISLFCSSSKWTNFDAIEFEISWIISKELIINYGRMLKKVEGGIKVARKAVSSMWVVNKNEHLCTQFTQFCMEGKYVCVYQIEHDDSVN